MSRLTAFVLRGEQKRCQRVRVEVADDDQEGGAFVDQNLLPEELAFNVSAVVVWSWDTWNIEISIQDGNPTVPGMMAIIPERLVLPVVDLYWRF